MVALLLAARTIGTSHYCVVMMRAGVPKAMTNDMMKRYTGQDQDNQILEKYRYGALWVNRCAAALLENGWGYKSWEIFLLEPDTGSIRSFRR
ncbi:hypothetical protein PENSOL_c082G01054 [Penicillium solitum]|uniref:Uncharacterized protein n=1 Tax=Penicillium solitum TaxID=60172 RepID=A0A1V6QCI4_9EURO|nr:uncharacterized protein PENSOL_c082G01054 [Penicillium solitum]OQD86923.1 hypothetical protein PENSOL_c082G01054 [Penicillium solitum]